MTTRLVDLPAWQQWPKIMRSVVRVLIVYVPIAALAILFTLPLLWLISSSLKPETQVFEFPPRFIPRQIRWANYPDVIDSFPFVTSARNTLAVVFGVMIGRVLTASMAAYAFARLRFPGRDALFVVVLGTLMIPYHVTLIPQYLLFRDLGWLNSFKPLIVPSWFGGGAFFIFLLRQFFQTIPTEYDDAARIDGCGFVGIYRRIILPMSLPALGTTAIFTFMWEWNDVLAPLIYLNTPDKRTLAVAFQEWQRIPHGSDAISHPWNQIMAVAFLVCLPPLFVFFFAQRHFIQGVVISGVKG